MTFQQDIVGLIEKLQNNYDALEKIVPYSKLSLNYVRTNLENVELIRLIQEIDQNTSKLETTLSSAAISTSNTIPGISDDLYRFYYDVIKPRKLNLVTYYIGTLDVDPHELLEILKSPKSVSTPIKDIFQTGIDFWEEDAFHKIIPDDANADDVYEGEKELEQATSMISAPYFEPDRWVANSRDLKPIMLTSWIKGMPLPIKKRLNKLYLCYMFGNYMAAISLCRAILEYAVIDTLKNLGIEVRDSKKDKILEFWKLIERLAKKLEINHQELDFIRNSGNAIMHPERSDKISEFRVRKDHSWKCIHNLITALEVMYR